MITPNPARGRGITDKRERIKKIADGVACTGDQLKHRRRVAIKVLKPKLSAVLGGERFLREIGIAAALQHPHVLPRYD